MKTLTLAAALLMPPGVYADTIILKDGTRLEGRIEGEMDGTALVRTQYGTLTIKKNDIVSQIKAEETPAAASLPKETPAVSTETVVRIPASSVNPPAVPMPEYTFKTITLSTMAYEHIYYENEAPIATELFDSKGNLVGVRGTIKDATYREYYDAGAIKTEKSMVNAKLSGPLKVYYPGGLLQSEAHYLDGLLNGSVRVYNETGKPLLEQNFKAGVPNGFFREFDGFGALKSEIFYIDGHIAEKPASGASAARTEAPDSGVTAKSRQLARVERITFYLNGKYIGKLQLDKDFNLISQRGKLPDGSIKIYDQAGLLEKELLYTKNNLISLKTYGDGNSLENEYYYQDGKAVKK